jgi:hypothetical protein
MPRDDRRGRGSSAAPVGVGSKPMGSHMFPERIRLTEIDLLNKERIHIALEPIVSRLLGPQGFESYRRLVWVRSTDAPIRQVFRLQQLKGVSLCAQFGLSLDFVPHVSGSQVRWHRTPKFAILDLCVQMQNANMLFRISTVKGAFWSTRLECWNRHA